MSLLPTTDKSLWGKFKGQLCSLKNYGKTTKEGVKRTEQGNIVQDSVSLDSSAVVRRRNKVKQRTLMVTFENDDTYGIAIETTADTTHGSVGGDQLSVKNCTCCRRCLHRRRLNMERLKHSLCEAQVRNGWMLDRQRDMEIENNRLMKSWCESEAKLKESKACHLRESKASLREFESRLRELEAKDVAAEYSNSRLVARLHESDMENHRLRYELAELLARRKQQEAEWSELVDRQKRQDNKLSIRVAEHRAVLSMTIAKLQVALSSCVSLQTVANRQAILETDLQVSGSSNNL